MFARVSGWCYYDKGARQIRLYMKFARRSYERSDSYIQTRARKVAGDNEINKIYMNKPFYARAVDK